MAMRHPALTFVRAFSSTPSVAARSTGSKIAVLHKNIPEYPYGPARWYKQSNFGLYGGSRIQFGNKVSEKNEIKTRRKWRPNIRYKKLYSVALQKYLRIRINTRVLRTIDKVGGLDEYLLGDKAMRLKELGMEGWLLRWRILQTESVKQRFAEERKRLGLPEQNLSAMSSDGRVVSVEELQEEIQRFDQELNAQQQVAAKEDAEESLENDFMREEPAPEKPKATL
ncbi:hypothetical protein L228DRAFT_250354 [Xylona heveae TC161]|uniref:Large ribosomal subunit protein bL28m n=1 Tax=Xylona heveae (strain CBS 132557 / TC161) TaxID=1328760 RepID=A0A165A4J3_XYLHT|nr:hypothetical protein L228DRAFT_250354 [Xylona heveae TC161]KZF19937.1 hypothetical protein L228DRAFT_250354 [Xylona heveae TC161]